MFFQKFAIVFDVQAFEVSSIYFRKVKIQSALAAPIIVDTVL